MNRETHGIVLDLDDTLIDTFLSLGRELWKQWPVDDFSSAEALLQVFGHPALVPRWQMEECAALSEKLLSDTDFLLALPEIEGRLKDVQRLEENIPVSLYLTSRMPFAYETTVAWLQNHGFPSAPVVCRPVEVQMVDWKVRYLEQWYPWSYGLVDNELHAPESFEYAGKLMEIPRFTKLTPAHPAVIQVQSWDELLSFVGGSQEPALQ